jgi:hypothetical protein
MTKRTFTILLTKQRLIQKYFVIASLEDAKDIRRCVVGTTATEGMSRKRQFSGSNIRRAGDLI